MAQFLVLEEDRRQFEQIKQCLQTKGHKAWRASTSAEAFEFLGQYSVDLILSAINLENSDVFEFLRQLKGDEKLKRITFVFYCTEQERCDRYATPAIEEAGKALGAHKYALLPAFDANRFWEQLADCIPAHVLKNNSLGGEVKMYSLTDFAWTKPKQKAG